MYVHESILIRILNSAANSRRWHNSGIPNGRDSIDSGVSDATRALTIHIVHSTNMYRRVIGTCALNWSYYSLN